MIQTGNYPEYHQIFRKMIQELQPLSLIMKNTFQSCCGTVSVSRKGPVGTVQKPDSPKRMEAATQFLMSILQKIFLWEDYTLSRHMSTCWFIRSFKRYNEACASMQYIVNFRITNAKTLLHYNLILFPQSGCSRL